MQPRACSSQRQRACSCAKLTLCALAADRQLVRGHEAAGPAAARRVRFWILHAVRHPAARNSAHHTGYVSGFEVGGSQHQSAYRSACKPHGAAEHCSCTPLGSLQCAHVSSPSGHRGWRSVAGCRARCDRAGAVGHWQDVHDRPGAVPDAGDQQELVRAPAPRAQAVASLSLPPAVQAASTWCCLHRGNGQAGSRRLYHGLSCLLTVVLATCHVLTVFWPSELQAAGVGHVADARAGEPDGEEHHGAGRVHEGPRALLHRRQVHR